MTQLVKKRRNCVTMRWQPAQPTHANNKAVELQISAKTDLLTMSPFWVKWRNMQQKLVETTNCLMTIIHCLVWQKNIHFFCASPILSQKLVSGTPYNHGSLEPVVSANQLSWNPTDVWNSKLSAGWGHKWLTMQHSGTEDWNRATEVTLTLKSTKVKQWSSCGSRLPNCAGERCMEQMWAGKFDMAQLRYQFGLPWSRWVKRAREWNLNTNHMRCCDQKSARTFTVAFRHSENHVGWLVGD